MKGSLFWRDWIWSWLRLLIFISHFCTGEVINLQRFNQLPIRTNILINILSRHLFYDKYSRGAKAYLALAGEVLKQHSGAS